ncbi:MAG: dUTP diphosphatase [Acidobacteria bacterium]|nr:dUTP diphosphatase [Acidobacteriota bacterium]
MDEESSPIEVLIQRLPGNDLPLPARSTAQSAGYDLRACLDAPLTLEPMRRALVPTGFAIALPPGWEAQIRPRSGLALEHGITMLNTPGTIDADYRGEIKVLAVNLGDRPVTLRRGDRIAQMVLARVPGTSLRETDALPATPRGAGGFGHTGSR